MAFEALTLAETAVGRFITQTLMRKIKNSLDALYSATGGAIVIPNGSFEIDSDADGQPDQWDTTAYTGGTIGLETTSPIEGASSLKMVHPGGGGNGGGYADSDFVSCAPGRSETLLWLHYSSAAGMKNQVIIRQFDKDQVDLSSDITLYSSTANPTASTNFSGTWTPDSTARYFKIRAIGGFTDTDVAGTAYFDAFSLHIHQPQMREITDTSNITLNAAPTQTNFGSTFTLNIPQKGFLKFYFTGRIQADVSAIGFLYVGVRIGSTNYWAQFSDNGSAAYNQLHRTPSTSGQYHESKGFGTDIIDSSVIVGINIEALSVPTGNQTVQLIVGRGANACSLRGATTTSKMYLEVLEAN